MARQVAYGTQFFRTVVFDNTGRIDGTYGPFTTVGTSKTQGKANIRSTSWQPRDDWYYQIQELKPVVDQNQDYTKEIVATLEWVDIDG